MCFNAPMSLASWIIGSLVSISLGVWSYHRKYKELSYLCWGWLWVIAMQGWEYGIWKTRDKPKELAFFTYGAYLWNILQLPFLFFLFFSISTASLPCKRISAALLFIYLLITLIPYKGICPPTINSRYGHLQYSWWGSSFWGNIRSVAYLVTFGCLFLCLIRPWKWSLSCVMLLFALLGCSFLWYKHCVASLWCWFAAFFPLASTLLHELI